MCLMLRLLLPLVVTTLLIVNVVQADEENVSMTMDEVVQALESFASNCDPVPTREHMEEVVLNKKDAQTGSKCFRYCMMSQFDMLKVGTNQIDKEKTKEMIEMIVPDDEAAVYEIIDKCNQKNAKITDNCEVAHEHSMCIIDEFKARGIKIPEVKKE